MDRVTEDQLRILRLQYTAQKERIEALHSLLRAYPAGGKNSHAMDRLRALEQHLAELTRKLKWHGEH
jgi:hypothetical protein